MNQIATGMLRFQPILVEQPDGTDLTGTIVRMANDGIPSVRCSTFEFTADVDETIYASGNTVEIAYNATGLAPVDDGYYTNRPGLYRQLQMIATMIGPSGLYGHITVYGPHANVNHRDIVGTTRYAVAGTTIRTLKMKDHQWIDVACWSAGDPL